MKIAKYLANLEDMTGKEVIVTGGTSGIGLSIVKHLLLKHAKVIVMARNMKKSEEVKNKLLETYPDNPIEIIQFDQSDKESIFKACDEIINHHKDFYAIILNAGLIQSGKTTTYVNDVPQTTPINFVILVHNNNYYYYFIDKIRFTSGYGTSTFFYLICILQTFIKNSKSGTTNRFWIFSRI